LIFKVSLSTYLIEEINRLPPYLNQLNAVVLFFASFNILSLSKISRQLKSFIRFILIAVYLNPTKYKKAKSQTI